MRYARYSKDFNKYETARQNAYYDEKDDGTLSTCGNAIDKLGLYEEIDESPEHLAKIKQAFEIIKKYFWLDDFQDFVALNGRLPKSLKEECDLLKEVLL